MKEGDKDNVETHETAKSDEEKQLIERENKDEKGAEEKVEASKDVEKGEETKKERNDATHNNRCEKRT